MIFKRLYEAYYLGRASHDAMNGNVGRGLWFIEKIRHPVKNKAITDSLRAYLYIMNGQKDKAQEAIVSAKRNADEDMESGAFVKKYCDYLAAMIAGRVAEFNALSSELRNLSIKCRAKSLLVVDRPIPLNMHSLS